MLTLLRSARPKTRIKIGRPHDADVIPVLAIKISLPSPLLAPPIVVARTAIPIGVVEVLLEEVPVAEGVKVKGVELSRNVAVPRLQSSSHAESRALSFRAQCRLGTRRVASVM